MIDLDLSLSALLVYKLAIDMRSLLRLAASLDFVPRPSVVREQFEIYFLPLMAVGVEFWGLVVLVGAWYGEAILVPNGV